MYRKLALSIAIAGMTALLAGTGWADVPAPPVNQTIGMLDVMIGDFTEADCRACHDSGVPERHHLLYGEPIPPDSLVPFPDADGDGTPDTIYGCLNCHNEDHTLVRDCVTCHTASAHHTMPDTAATPTDSNCTACHGSLIDDIDDLHYIPTYGPSLVTPDPGDGGAGLPANARGTKAGGCAYCHDDDGLTVKVVLSNVDLHHAVRDQADPDLDCAVCHDFSAPAGEGIRACEGCHGPDSLHNIQADSPAAGNIGTVVVGGEDAGYGHVGRDAGPGDSDCWGCHGFATAFAPYSGPVIPTVYGADLAVITAGTDTMVVLTGAAFTNTIGSTRYESDVALTAADGSSVTLTPDIIMDQGILAVTIPGSTAPGNYNLQAVKDDFASNPAVISIVPGVSITSATFDGTVTISGNGFGGYVEGSGTSVTGTITTGKVKKATPTTAEAIIVSWSDTKIEADFGLSPDEVTVNSVFGSATTSKVKKSSKPDKDKDKDKDKDNGRDRGRNK